MPDYGARVSDKAIRETERKLRSTYSTAQRELRKKLKSFNDKYKVKDAAKKKQLAEGKISKQDYADWKAGQVFQQKQWKAKVKEAASVMTNSNEQAAKIVNEGRLDVFSENYNFSAFLGEQQLGISFDVYNTQAVARLIQDDPQILPEWKIDEEKDYEWNEKKVNNIVQQGIIQGEGIPEITKRLCADLATQNENKMRMFARTAMTGAQNAGRQKQMEDAADMGIKVEKQWIATLDSRTRDAHRDRDGETVPYNEEFSGGLEYPGDPAGAPADVYNCRCTMITVYPEHAAHHEGGARRAYSEYEDEDGKHRDGYLTENPNVYEGWSEKAYRRWLEKKQKQNEIAELMDEKPSLESLRKIAERSTDKIDFWMNLDEQQQELFRASGMSLEQVYSELGGGTNISEWKEPNPGDATSFGIKHDFSSATIVYQKVPARSDGWMADANGTGVIRVREDGIDSWRFVIPHEAGHQLANYCPELQNMILNNPGNVLGRFNLRTMSFDGIYGEYNPEEAFATGVSVYMRYPDEMKEKYPEAYNAIDSLFNASPTARDFVERAMKEYERSFM